MPVLPIGVCIRSSRLLRPAAAGAAVQLQRRHRPGIPLPLMRSPLCLQQQRMVAHTYPQDEPESF